jgi:hypothetical protein
MENNEIDETNAKRDCLLIELLIRVSSLERLLLESKIITEDQLTNSNIGEGKRITEELQKEVEKLVSGTV